MILINTVYVCVNIDDNDIIFEIINVPSSKYDEIKKLFKQNPNLYTRFNFPKDISFNKYELVWLLNPLDNSLAGEYTKNMNIAYDLPYDIENHSELIDLVIDKFKKFSDNSIKVGYCDTFNKVAYGIGNHWLTINNVDEVVTTLKPDIYFNMDKLRKHEVPRNINIGDLIIIDNNYGIVRYKHVNTEWVINEYVFEVASITNGEIYRVLLMESDNIEIISQYETTNDLVRVEKSDKSGDKMTYNEFIKKYHSSIPTRFGLEQLFTAQLLMEHYLDIDSSTVYGFSKTSNNVYFSFGPESLGSHLIDAGASYSLVTNLKKLMKRYSSEIKRNVASTQTKFRSKPFSKKLYGEGKNNRYQNDIEIYYLEELQEIVYTKLQDKVHPVVLKSLLGPDMEVNTDKDDLDTDTYYYNTNSLITFEVIDKDNRTKIIPINNIPYDVFDRVFSITDDRGYDELCKLKSGERMNIKVNGNIYKVIRVVRNNNDLKLPSDNKIYDYNDVTLQFNEINITWGWDK